MFMANPQRPAYVRKLSFTWTAYIVSIFGIVLFSSVGRATAQVSLQPGVQITQKSSLQTQVSITPDLAFDTVVSNADTMLVARLPGARVRQNSQGTIVQAVVSVQIPVAHPGLFALVKTEQTTKPLALPLQALTTPLGNMVPTPPVLDGQFQIKYSGIGRGQCYATLDVVVAETKDGATVMHPTSVAIVEQALATPVHPSIANKQSETTQAITAMSPVARFVVPQEGVYRITAQQLRDAGLPTDAAAAQSIKVFGWGGRELSEQVQPPLNDVPNEIPLFVSTQGDGSIAEIVFYASGPTGWQYTTSGISHYIHHYDRNVSYLVTTWGNAGKRSQPRQAAQSPVINRPLTVSGFVFNEDELVNPYASGSGRKWLGRSIENGGALVVTLPLPGLVRTGGDVQYRSVVAHRSSVSGTMTAYENGNPIMQRVLPPVPEYMDAYSAPFSGTLSASQLATDARSTLRFEYKCSDRSATGLMDWVEIIYPRGLVADDRSFSFFTDPKLSGVTEYSINGFETDNIYLFDVTEPQTPIQVANAGPSGGLAVIREQLDSGVVRRYYASSNIRSVSLTSLPTLSLRSRADAGELGAMIIITHPDLRESADRYAEYRSSQGEISTTVVTTTEIMNEFGYGTQDPTAIRDFLGYVYRHAVPRPTYVLLWGDGHFDYKQLSTLQTNYVIPYESLDPDDVSYGLSTYTSDDFFVRVEGNDARPDFAIGRLPVTSNEVGDMLRNKIDHYEHHSSQDDWRARAVLMADDGPTSDNKSDGTLHLNQSEDLAANKVPLALQTKKIYLVEYPTDNIARGRRKPGASNDLVSTVNTTGGLLVNWIGHGNPRVWAHEFAFERETTPQRMTNWDKLFFLTAATCDFARFDLTDVQSGAEELVLHPNGGAIGVFSSARVVFSYANSELNKAFYGQLFTPDSTGTSLPLGEVLFRVKQQFTSDNDEKFFLMADPSMRILIPNHKVVFETINGKSISDTALINLKALETVTVTGHIERPLGGGTDTSFTGVATVSLLDGMRQMVVTDDDVAHTINRFTLQGAPLTRGSYRVENGTFVATFVVPKDIAYSTSNATLYGYAYSTDNRSAMGASSSVIVDGISSEQHNDAEGPDIAIYLDSRFFLDGQVVRPTPVLLVDLADATGINATGVGVGHDIEADFDGGSLVENLTETFATSLDNPRAGTASKQIFGLAAGRHSVRVRAWDVLNNSSTATTTFMIAPAGDGVVASWLMNYPNPFSQSTTIRFQHNVNQPFSAVVRIYDAQGRMLVQRDMEIRDMQTAEIQWDGRDGNGNHAGSGVYLCSVQTTLTDGTVGNVYGKLVLIR